MRVLISGASGLIGSALRASLSEAGHQVVRLVRTSSPADEATVFWDPASDYLDPTGIEGFDAVIHLAGESIAEGRWTPQKMERIRNSRVHGTRLLCETLAGLSHRPKVLLSASAVGFYGDCGDQRLDEESPSGTGFLAEVTRQWEEATQLATAADIRVVLLRFGMVLSKSGGALAKMLPVFRMGLGGRLGSGQQCVSWITLDDIAGAIEHLLSNEQLSGPFNLVSPRPVTSRRFTDTLASTLRRPALLPMPAAVLQVLFGPMADELLLASTRAIPRRLLASGYQFRDPELDAALRRVLRTPEDRPRPTA